MSQQSAFKIRALQSLRDEMVAVANGSAAAPLDAKQPSFSSQTAAERHYHREGALARDNGLTQDECPYVDGSMRGKFWLLGYAGSPLSKA